MNRYTLLSSVRMPTVAFGPFDAMRGILSGDQTPATPAASTPPATAQGGMITPRQEPAAPAATPANPATINPLTGAPIATPATNPATPATPQTPGTPTPTQGQTDLANMMAQLAASHTNNAIQEGGGGLQTNPNLAWEAFGAMMSQGAPAQEPDAFEGLPVDRLTEALGKMDLTTGLNLPEVMTMFSDPDKQQEAFGLLSTNIMSSMLQVVLPLINSVGEKAVNHSVKVSGNTLESQGTEQAVMTVLKNSYPHLADGTKLAAMQPLVRMTIPHSKNPTEAAHAVAALLTSMAGGQGTQTQQQGAVQPLGDFSSVFS